MAQEHEEYIYTINSTDKDHYNRISANLDMPNSEYSIFQVTELTTKCSILVLTSQDYFVLNDKTYYFKTDYSDLSNEAFASVVDDLIASDKYFCEVDGAYRIHFFAADEKLTLQDMTYNCQLMFGLHDIKLPLESKEDDSLKPAERTYVDDEGEVHTETVNVNQDLVIETVGFTLSTPVLYLLSNVGAKTFKNKLDDEDKSYMATLRTAMRINNSFSANYPIISGNCDFKTVIKSNDLTNVMFWLVDANLKELTLLSPLYLTIHVIPIPDAIRNSNELEVFINNLNQRQQ